MSDSTTTVDDPVYSSGAMGAGKPVPVKHRRFQNRGKALLHCLMFFLLMAAIAMAAAPVAGYKKGWTKYRRSDYQPPQQYGVPVPIKLNIWAGWYKGSDSLRDLLHAAEPTRVPQYVLVKDVQHAGLVVTGFTVAFLLLSGLVGASYLLVIIFATCTRRPNPPGLFITAIFVGFFNCAWSIACYIVLAVGVAKETRQQLNGATFISWPDWCFFLAFFSGVFWLIVAALAKSATPKRSHSLDQLPRKSDPHMTHNMAYNKHGSVANGTNGMSDTGATGVASV